MRLEEKKMKYEFANICSKYSEGDPLDELIAKSGIGIIDFYKYMAEDVEREAEFEKAKLHFQYHQENNIVNKALISLEKLITGYEEIEYTEEFTPLYDDEGREVGRKILKRKETNKHYQPRVEAVIFALQKLVPNKYSDPAKLLPEKPKELEQQIYKIGDQIIRFS